MLQSQYSDPCTTTSSVPLTFAQELGRRWSPLVLGDNSTKLIYLASAAARRMVRRTSAPACEFNPPVNCSIESFFKRERKMSAEICLKLLLPSGQFPCHYEKSKKRASDWGQLCAPVPPVVVR
jgi:hypothetical protein